MKIKSLVALTLLLSCGSTLAAEQKFASVQVRAGAPFALEMSCSNPSARPIDVEQVLQINDRSQTAALSAGLKAAVGEACNEGVAGIAVSRGANGRSVTWTATHNIDTSVAAN